MTLEQMLGELAIDMERLLERFMSSNMGMFLRAPDIREYHRICLEASELLQHELGPNAYSNQIIATNITDSGVYLAGGPSRATVEKVHGTILAAKSMLKRRAMLTPTTQVRPVSRDPYVSSERLAQLRMIVSSNWDLTRLVRLCEELNTAHETGSLMSTAMLVRSIMDHVPPIFAAADFNAAANNYAWPGRSIRSSIQNLQNSLRNVADAHLHLHIRQREVLPTAPQVDFKADLDVLLGEVVRALKR